MRILVVGLTAHKVSKLEAENFSRFGAILTRFLLEMWSVLAHLNGESRLFYRVSQLDTNNALLMTNRSFNELVNC